MRPGEKIESLLYTIPIVVIVLGVIVGVALWAITAGPAEDTRDKVQETNLEVGSLPPLGNPSAPVQIVVFSDYRCPFCAQFFNEVEQRLRAEYVRRGDVVILWRDFAVLGPDSVRAARAARCANEQGAFWRYHDLLFAEREGGFGAEPLAPYAERLGLDGGAFAQCLSSGRGGEAVARDQELGRERGVQGVPTVFINGRKVAGAQPYEVFRSAIEEALRK